MAMINKHDIFPKIVLSKIKDWPASQEKSLLAWKDRVRRYKELLRSLVGCLLSMNELRAELILNLWVLLL